jgi:hypothetical protein
MTAPYEYDVIKLSYFLEFSVEEELELSSKCSAEYKRDLTFERIAEVRKLVTNFLENELKVTVK